MFSDEPRCRYSRNPLAEVICQLRFPRILSISAQAPVRFQEELRREYPGFSSRQEPSAPLIPGQPRPADTINYQFSSPDGVWRINLTDSFLSLTCSRYTCWEDFAQHLDRPLASFIQIYDPAYFERIGLRYLNVISRRDMDLSQEPYQRLINPIWLGPLSDPMVSEGAVSRCGVDFDGAVPGGCRVKIHAGPGLIRRPGQMDNEAKFIWDLDLYVPNQVPVARSAGVLQTLHGHAFPLFRGAVTDLLHDAMEPQAL